MTRPIPLLASAALLASCGQSDQVANVQNRTTPSSTAPAAVEQKATPEQVAQAQTFFQVRTQEFVKDADGLFQRRTVLANGDGEYVLVLLRGRTKNPNEEPVETTGYKFKVGQFATGPEIVSEGGDLTSVKLVCAGPQCVESGVEGQPEQSLNSLSLLYATRDEASRVAKALDVLIRANGGKPAPF